MEDASDDARDLQRPARFLADGIDPAEDEALEAVRELQRTEGAGILRIDPWPKQVDEQLLDVERRCLPNVR